MTVTVTTGSIQIPKALTAAPGYGVIDRIGKAVQVKKGPAFASSDLTTGAMVFELFKLPPGISVIDVVVENTTAWTLGSGKAYSFTVGDSGAVARYMSSDVFTATAGVKHSGAGFAHTPASSDPHTIKAYVTVPASSDAEAGTTQSWLYYTEGEID